MALMWARYYLVQLLSPHILRHLSARSGALEKRVTLREMARRSGHTNSQRTAGQREGFGILGLENVDARMDSARAVY